METRDEFEARRLVLRDFVLPKAEHYIKSSFEANKLDDHETAVIHFEEFIISALGKEKFQFWHDLVRSTSSTKSSDPDIKSFIMLYVECSLLHKQKGKRPSADEANTRMLERAAFSQRLSSLLFSSALNAWLDGPFDFDKDLRVWAAKLRAEDRGQRSAPIPGLALARPTRPWTRLANAPEWDIVRALQCLFDVSVDSVIPSEWQLRIGFLMAVAAEHMLAPSNFWGDSQRQTATWEHVVIRGLVGDYNNWTISLLGPGESYQAISKVCENPDHVVADPRTYIVHLGLQHKVWVGVDTFAQLCEADPASLVVKDSCKSKAILSAANSQRPINSDSVITKMNEIFMALGMRKGKWWEVAA